MLQSKRNSTARCAPCLSDVAWQKAFRRQLLAWYDGHARPLPWRATRDPYAIWVSEIMLQQTQVATVLSYWPRFLHRFPDIASLAEAEEREVLQLWEGLGYYRRARQLHRAARALVEQHEGIFPHDPTIVRSLPGIGRYTAGAILSIAFDAREPIVEANTIRLYTRLLGYRGDPRSAAGQRLLWSAAAEWVPLRRTGAFNQALMELGSELCTPKQPQCEACPVNSLCVARREGIQHHIPRPAKRPTVVDSHEAAVVVRRRHSVLLACNDGPGRWAGLWDFPRFPVQADRGTRLEGELVDGVAHLTGLSIEPGRHLTTIKHGVTRYRITLDCYEAELVGTGRAKPGWKWLKVASLHEIPLNVTARRLARLIVANRPI